LLTALPDWFRDRPSDAGVETRLEQRKTGWLKFTLDPLSRLLTEAVTPRRFLPGRVSLSRELRTLNPGLPWKSIFEISSRTAFLSLFHRAGKLGETPDTREERILQTMAPKTPPRTPLEMQSMGEITGTQDQC
jgi:hypothetical protein